MHTDPELLSLFALGEDAGTENDRVHARTCPECAADLSELHRVVALVRPTTCRSRPRGHPAAPCAWGTAVCQAATAGLWD